MTNEELEAYGEEILDLVSSNVKRIREEKGFSQLQLATEIGLNGSAYLGRCELRKPRHHFNIKLLAKISRVLETPINKFFE